MVGQVKHEPPASVLTKKGARKLHEKNLLKGKPVDEAQRVWQGHDKLDAHHELTGGRHPCRPSSDDYGLPPTEEDEPDDSVPLDRLLR